MLEVDNKLGLKSLSFGGRLLRNKGLETLNAELDRLLVSNGVVLVGQLEQTAKLRREVTPWDLLARQELVLPEFATDTILNGDIDNDVVKLSDNLLERGALVRVGLPAASNKIPQGRLGAVGYLRALVLGRIEAESLPSTMHL